MSVKIRTIIDCWDDIIRRRRRWPSTYSRHWLSSGAVKNGTAGAVSIPPTSARRYCMRVGVVQTQFVIDSADWPMTTRSQTTGRQGADEDISAPFLLRSLQRAWRTAQPHVNHVRCSPYGLEISGFRPRPLCGETKENYINGNKNTVPAIYRGSIRLSSLDKVYELIFKRSRSTESLMSGQNGLVAMSQRRLNGHRSYRVAVFHMPSYMYAMKSLQ